MNPTQEQLNARLNPTPVTIKSPTSGLFRATGDYGSSIYKVGPDGKYQVFDVTDVGRKQIIGDSKPDQYGNYSALSGQNSGSQASAGLSYLKNIYGFDYNSLPEFNLADNQNNIGGGRITDAASFFSNPAPSGSSSSVINNTQNTLATPQDIQTQMKNPAWNSGTTPIQGQTGALQSQLGGFPTSALQPGMNGDEVKKLQNYLVSKGLMTQDQVNTGYGTYGPQTTAAVAALQKQLGVDNSSGPGYFGPKTLGALQGGQQGSNTGGSPNLGNIQTGITDATSAAQKIQAQIAALQGTSSGATSTGAQTSSTGSTGGVGGADQAYQDYLKNLTPSSQENNLQGQVDALTAQQAGINASRDLGIQAVGEQPIATPFITGQSAAITNRAAVQSGAIGAQALPIQQQLARQQAIRQSAMDVSKANLEYQQGKEKNASDTALKLQELANSKAKTEGDQSLALKKFNQDVKEFGMKYALDQQKLANDKANDDAKTAPNANAVELKNNALSSANDLLTKFNAGKGTSAVGRSRLFGGQYIPGTPQKDFSVQFDNLKSLLSLDNVKLLKGQGAVSDAERQLLADASSKLNLSQSEGEFKSALEGIIKALGGNGAAGVTSTGLKYEIIK